MRHGGEREESVPQTMQPSGVELFCLCHAAVSDMAAHVPSTEAYSNAYLSSSVHLRSSNISHTYQLIKDMAPISRWWVNYILDYQKCSHRPTKSRTVSWWAPEQHIQYSHGEDSLQHWVSKDVSQIGENFGNKKVTLFQSISSTWWKI